MGYRHPNPRLPKGHRSYFRSTDRRKTPDPAAIAIVVEAAQDAPGYFIARLLGDDREFARSRTPFCDAARKLLDHGISPAAMLVMRRARGTIVQVSNQLAAAPPPAPQLCEGVADEPPRGVGRRASVPPS
jgi:hypothetical protein